MAHKINNSFAIETKYYNEPAVDTELSGGILTASANNVVKYTAQITLSAASPAAKTEGEIRRASAMAT